MIVAWVAMCGSLFMSETMGWLPCTLCWYQRICMYPLAVIIPIGVLRRDPGLRKYVLPPAIIGALIALYHYLQQKTSLFPPFPCQMGISCQADYLNWLGGVVTIPFLALIAFLLIIFLMVASSLTDEDTAEEEQRLKQSTLVLPVVAIAGIVVVGFVFLGAFVKG